MLFESIQILFQAKLPLCRMCIGTSQHEETIARSCQLHYSAVQFDELHHTPSVWFVSQFRQRYTHKKIKKPKKYCDFFLAWQDPENWALQILILNLLKVLSWLTYGWKSLRFWWYFHTFHENEDGVLLKIRL